MLNVPRMDQIKFNESGEYGSNPAWGFSRQAGHEGEIIFRCGCGQLMHGLIEQGWQVSPEGNVTPSIWHDVADGGCGFHEFVHLEGYRDRSDG